MGRLTQAISTSLGFPSWLILAFLALPLSPTTSTLNVIQILYLYAPSLPSTMAVLEDLGLEVTVEVAQVPAAEYPDPEHDTDNNIGPQTKTNHCFIESRVNQEFHIAAGIKPGGKSPAARWIAKKKRGFSITVAVDGPSRLAGKVLSREHEHVLVKGVVDHAGHTIRHFLFAAVSTGK